MSSKTSTPRPAVTCGSNGGINERGEACGVAMNLSPTTGLCIHHDPKRVDEARALYKTGGAAATRATHLRRIERMTTTPENMPRFKPDTLERLAAWLQWTVTAVGTGQVDARTAAEMTRALQQLRPVLTSIGLDRRVKELERELRAYKKRAGRQ